MKLRGGFAIIGLLFIAVPLLMACFMTPVFAQQEQKPGAGIVDDWTHHHLIFSNPGTLEDAERNGKAEEWHRIVRDSRYRMQWFKRYDALSGETATPRQEHPELREADASDSSFGEGDRDKDRDRDRDHRTGKERKETLHADWAVTLAAVNGGVALHKFPAKYSFSPVGAPNCTTDFVVFPINSPGNSAQANLLGANNLYATTCTGAVPNLLFAYNVGTGDVQTSPVLSEDGTKVAFVETITGNGTSTGSIFHVLTLDKSGNAGCPNSPCNGTSSNKPATPGTNNSAVDRRITMSGFVTDSNSGPFVDYQHDVAYVGDDTGRLHKFTGVFLGTPAEAGSPWPFAAAASALTNPVYDSVSTNIFFGTANGNLHCVTNAGANCATSLISVAGGTTPGPVMDGPIVDSTNGKVYAMAGNSANSVLLQANTALGAVTRVNVGASGTDLYDGAFDNAYLASTNGTGNMYVCGNLTSAATPALWQIRLSAGAISSTAQVFQLVSSGNTGTGSDCTPLTEVLNGTTDFLFVGVIANGFNTGTPNCANDTCIMSFSLPQSSPFTFPAAAIATGTNSSLNLGNKGISGFIIDNVSSVTGASQIYFGNLQANTGVQASQAALR